MQKWKGQCAPPFLQKPKKVTVGIKQVPKFIVLFSQFAFHFLWQLKSECHWAVSILCSGWRGEVSGGPSLLPDQVPMYRIILQIRKYPVWLSPAMMSLSVLMPQPQFSLFWRIALCDCMMLHDADYALLYIVFIFPFTGDINDIFYFIYCCKAWKPKAINGFFSLLFFLCSLVSLPAAFPQPGSEIWFPYHLEKIDWGKLLVEEYWVG